jgi:penicillin amidase
MSRKAKSIGFLFITCVLFTPGFSQAQQNPPPPPEETLSIPGLREPVEIVKDAWGISHIFARSQPDLFFAQGFNVARDRLFQLEMWRRQATGTLAEILGPRALDRDIGARLLKARVDMDLELAHYHPDGREIIGSFVRGINAYIDHTRRFPELLPREFRLLGLQPNHWTPEVVVSRHNGLFRNAGTEIGMAGAVSAMGSEKILELLDLHPGKPELTLPRGLDAALLSREILGPYSASRSSIRFLPENIQDPSKRAPAKKKGGLEEKTRNPFSAYQREGSNNWVVSGEKTLTGTPFMANDPHRRQQIPSLRYWVHLNAPGWDVIGGGEPALPGISIGHNRYGAWGLTIFSVDQEDLYVYDLHPEDPDRYRYKGGWDTMRVFEERIPVRGQAPELVRLKYTRHGPVLFQDVEHRKAYALRAAWLEIGCAPYLASLRMDQARSWGEFREACSFSRTPSENMVWADREGNIGWQAVGITPLRPNWDGLMPVPGDGRYEWDGYLPIKSLPHVYNPPQGYFSTANQDNIPPGYPYSVGFMWADPFRQARIQEVLSSGRKFSLMDMMNLQHDVLSIPARSLVPLLDSLESGNEDVGRALGYLRAWDFRMNPDSVAAALYQSWQRRLIENVWRITVPEEERALVPRRSLFKLIAWLTAPDGRFGPDPVRGRDDLLLTSLNEAVQSLRRRLGSRMETWRYGQSRFHHITLRHPLSGAVTPELRPRLDLGPLPRGGNGNTVNQTSSGFNQTSGASFRILADLSDWDLSLGTNSPGQSGDPDSPHYRDLFGLWAGDKYFPVFFSRPKIESAAESVTRLIPDK